MQGRWGAGARPLWAIGDGQWFRSAHGHEGDALAVRIPRNALSAGIQCPLAVDGEEVVVVAVLEINFQAPSAIGLPMHWMRGGIPLVEITH